MLSEKVISPLTVITKIFSCLYFFCMILYPFINSNWSWSHVHSVWMDWQALNVGVLALVSSVIALNISIQHTEKQRKREFIAARSFLPEALSNLCSYFRLSSKILCEAWEKTKNTSSRCKIPLDNKIPQLPDNYREIFNRCIILADPEVAQYFSDILRKLQVHHSRIEDLYKSFQPDSHTDVDRPSLIDYLYHLAELQALVDKIYDFARGFKDFNDAPLTLDNFMSAYRNLDISRLDGFDEIKKFTESGYKERTRFYRLANPVL